MNVILDTTTEIERRFLLKNVPLVNPDQLLKIEQWYKTENGETIRYRKTTDFKTSTITFEAIIKKNVAPGVNTETAVAITKDELAILPGSPFISKMRSLYKYNELIFEVDDFKGMALVICEVELPTKAYLTGKLNFHPAIQNLVIKEITGEKEFSNYNLAKLRG